MTTKISPMPEWAWGLGAIQLAGPGDADGVRLHDYRMISAEIRTGSGVVKARGFYVQHADEVWIHPFPPSEDKAIRDLAELIKKWSTETV